MKIIIEKLEVTSFGCLKNATYSPTEGINRICAPNESGKTTLAAFIKFIFYGFGTSKKDIIDSEKKLYLPWDSSFAAGAAEISADGTKYRIERRYAPSQKEIVALTEVSSGKKVSPGKEIGELFFGVDRETAEKTFIFDQFCALTARDSELFDSIRNMVFQGDEDGNSESALKRLKAAKKELKPSRGNGMIDTLEKDFEKYKSSYDEAVNKISAVKEINEQIAKTEKTIERNVQSEKKFLAEMDNLEKYEAHLKLLEISELKKEAENAETAYNIAISSLNGEGLPDGELLDRLVSANTEKLSKTALIDEFSQSLKEKERELSLLKEKDLSGEESTEDIKHTLKSLSKSQKKFFAFAGAAGLLGVGLSALSFLNIPHVIYGGCAALVLSVIFSTIAIIKGTKRNSYIRGFNVSTDAELLALLNAREDTAISISHKEKEIYALKEKIEKTREELLSCEETLSTILGKYFKDTSNDSAELIKRLRNFSEKVAEAKKSAESKYQALKKTSELLDLTYLEERAEGAVKPERSRDEIEKQLKFVQNGKKLMEEKIITLEKEKAVIESSVIPPSLMYEKAEAVYKKLIAAKERLRALELAIELLEQAGDEMKATLAPKISHYASELFEIATDGKYQSLSVTTELSLSTDNGETVKSAEYLSAGARATAYICLRLALMKVIFNDTFPPIIFDDAFVRLDKRRLEQIKKAILASPAKDSQIFIFASSENQSI